MTNDTPTTNGDEPLATYATPLATTDPAGDTSDLAPLDDHLADASVVGLGEATHGTRECFRLKDRLIRHLVRDHGCRAVAFEANRRGARAIDAYVADGEGELDAALDAIQFWTWKTESVRDLLAWLRGFNADRPREDRVRFYGVDAQYTQGAVADLRAFLETADPETLAAHEAALATVDDEGTGSHEDDRLAERIEAAETLVPALEDRLTDRRDAAIAATSADRYERARHSLRRVAQATEHKRAVLARQNADDDVAATERALRVRDEAMAENVAWVRERSDGGPVATWAHDGHVTRDVQRSRRTGATAPSLGHHLADEYGEDYYALGFAFGRGSFQAIHTGDEDVGLCEHTLAEPRPDTVEERLAALGHDLAHVDLRTASADDRLADWLAAPQRHFSTGWAFDPADPEEFVTTHRYGDAFDGLLYVDETERARPMERAKDE